MSEYGPLRAAFEVDRLADLAASLGYSRRNDTETKPTAPGIVAADVERYAQLADEMNLSGSTSSGEFPSMGR